MIEAKEFKRRKVDTSSEKLAYYVSISYNY